MVGFSKVSNAVCSFCYLQLGQLWCCFFISHDLFECYVNYWHNPAAEWHWSSWHLCLNTGSSLSHWRAPRLQICQRIPSEQPWSLFTNSPQMMTVSLLMRRNLHIKYFYQNIQFVLLISTLCSCGMKIAGFYSRFHLLLLWPSPCCCNSSPTLWFP